MKKEEKIKILTTLEDYASTLKDERKAQKYGILLKVFIEVASKGVSSKSKIKLFFICFCSLTEVLACIITRFCSERINQFLKK